MEKRENGYSIVRDLSYYEPEWQVEGDAAYCAERCKLDLYYPEYSKGFSTVVFFHGGGFCSGEKSFPEQLKNAGLAVAAVNYRLSGERAKCPDYLNDAAAAVAWVLKHISEYGGNAGVVFITGHSAGGYLSAMLGLDPQWLNRFGADPSQLAGVAPVSGQMTTHFQILNEHNGTQASGQPLQLVIDEWAPLYHVRGDAPPMTLLVGDSTIEWPGRVEENALLAAQLKRVAGNPAVEFIALPGFDHGDVIIPALMLLVKRIWDFEFRHFIKEISNTELKIGTTPVSQRLSGRRGEAVEPATELSISQDGVCLQLDFACHCEDGRWTSSSASLWGGECLELFLAPDALQPERCRQIGISPEGRVEVISYLLPKVEASAVQVQTTIDQSIGGYRIQVQLPLAVFGIQLERPLAANFFRHRVTTEASSYQNWIFTWKELNLLPEAFARIRLLAQE